MRGWGLFHDAKNWAVSADVGADFVILRFGVSGTIELRLACDDAASEPNSESLVLVTNDVALNRLAVQAQSTARVPPLVDQHFGFEFQPLVKTFVHGAATGQHDLLVQATASIDGA